jgi:hypothetical protein
MLIHSGKRAPLARGSQENWEEAREAYLLEHASGLKEHYAAQPRAFRQIEEDAQNRHPDPTPDDIAAAVTAEAALPYRKRTEAQLRRDFERNYPGPCANWDSLIPCSYGPQRS